MSSQYPEDAKIELVEKEGEVTLYIDGGQAMQAWERELMWRSADILCAWGSEYLEVGLGLGLSALRIAGHDHTRRHTVVEKYQQVIDLFYQRHPEPPPNLQIVKADIFDFALTLEPDSLDGIFFDPYLSKDVPYDMQQLWGDVLPALVRSLRIGGAFVPYFSPQAGIALAILLLFRPNHRGTTLLRNLPRDRVHARRSGRCVHPMLRQDTIDILAQQTKSSKLRVHTRRIKAATKRQ